MLVRKSIGSKHNCVSKGSFVCLELNDEELMVLLHGKFELMHSNSYTMSLIS